MKLNVYIPHPLHPVIADIWEMQFEPDEIPQRQMVPPLGKPELIFYRGKPAQIAETNLERSIIKGQYTAVQSITLCQGASLVGLRLHAFGLFSLFGFDCSKLTDRVMDGTHFELMNELHTLIDADNQMTNSAMIELAKKLESQIRFEANLGTRSFIANVENKKSDSINELIRNVPVSLRTLQRRFLTEVGISPKKYVRLLRVNQIEQMLQNTKDWIEVATQFNLVDQSHLIKEVKSFRQQSPMELVDKRLLLHQQLPNPDIKSFNWKD